MDPVVTVIISICMSLLFGAAAAHKLRAQAAFRAAIEEYRLIPRAGAGAVAVFLLLVEWLAALLALIPPTQAAGLAVMAGLLCVYTLAIGINLYRGRRDIDCGCSGPASRQVLSGWLVLRNLLLLVLVLAALEPSTHRALNWLDLLVVAFGVPVASGLYLGINQLLIQLPGMTRLRSGV